MDLRKGRAKKKPMRIVLPEGEEGRIIRASVKAAEEGLAKPILLGDEDAINERAEDLGLSLRGVELLNPEVSPEMDEYVEKYLEIRRGKRISEAMARRILRRPLYYGAMMVRVGDADGMVAGAVSITASVIRASLLLIGLQKDITVPSSFFIMETKNEKIGENGTLIFADAAVNPDPTPEQLADIAIASARSAKALLGWTPRVAMLSFSTKGSAAHPLVDKVMEAVKIAKSKAPDIAMDGELQADAALLPSVAERKIKGDVGPVAGRANILIFPDLDAGNIAYKLVQHVCGAGAYGPILQGFEKSVSDLSRGAKAEEIVGVITVVNILAQGFQGRL